MKYLSVLLLLMFSFNLTSFAEGAPTKKIIYQYKKFESFNFDRFSVEGDSTTPGDISIKPRFRVKFKNRLPEKKSFSTESLDSLDMIQ